MNAPLSAALNAAFAGHSRRRRPRRRSAAARAAKSDRARALRDACLDFFPRAAIRWCRRSIGCRVARLPARVRLMCPRLRRLRRSLDFSGVWLLNASYQWGCTARAGEQDGAPWLSRTLDWPFRGLGRHTELARMRGRAGDFVSVTWPGYVGVLTAMAPRRFAAALNQAPMWRRTRHRWLRPYDFAANACASGRRRPHAAGPASAPGFRGVRDYAARGDAGIDAGRASGDLHAGRLRGERTLRDRADRNRFRHPGGRYLRRQ